MSEINLRVTGNIDRQKLKILLKEHYGEDAIIEGEDYLPDDKVLTLKPYSNGDKHILAGEVCIVSHRSESNKSLWVLSLTTLTKGCFEPKDLVLATEEQIQHTEQIIKTMKIWKSCGREYNIFKQDDIVALDQGTIGVVKKILPNAISCSWGDDEDSCEQPTDLRLVCPVERRLDRV